MRVWLTLLTVVIPMAPGSVNPNRPLLARDLTHASAHLFHARRAYAYALGVRAIDRARHASATRADGERYGAGVVAEVAVSRFCHTPICSSFPRPSSSTIRAGADGARHRTCRVCISEFSLACARSGDARAGSRASGSVGKSSTAKPLNGSPLDLTCRELKSPSDGLQCPRSEHDPKAPRWYHHSSLSSGKSSSISGWWAGQSVPVKTISLNPRRSARTP